MKISTFLLAACVVTAALGAETPPAGPRLRAVLGQLGVDTPLEDLAPAPIPGFFEVVRGTQVLYVAGDGDMLIDGDILSLATETNLTERARARVRRRLMAAVPGERRIVVPAAGEVRARVAVFADTDCPYCLKLHEAAADYARRGIEVQYLLYPRAGRSGATWAEAEAVWCAPDRDAALASVLAGGTLPERACDNPVAAHYELARALGLKGTPAIVTGSGRLHYGVPTADEILHDR
jgi:thiol:disulfide interchange protein DsbC